MGDRRPEGWREGGRVVRDGRMAGHKQRVSGGCCRLLKPNVQVKTCVWLYKFGVFSRAAIKFLLVKSFLASKLSSVCSSCYSQRREGQWAAEVVS